MKIEGLDELNDKLKELRDELGNKESGKALYNSLMYASTPMYQAIKSKVPVAPQTYKRYMSGGQGEGYYYDKNGKKRRRKAKRGTGKYQLQQPGRYKNAVKRRRLTKGYSANLQGAAVAIYIADNRSSTFSSVYYWRYLEYGTSHLPPNPIFRPAFDSNQAGATNRFAQKLGERIDKIMG